MLVAYADGPDGPLPDPAGLRVTVDEVLLGWVVRRPGWLDRSGPPVTTVMAGPGLRSDVASGRVRAVPTRLSAIPGLLAGRLRPDVTVVGAHEDRSGWKLAGSPGWALEAVRRSKIGVVVERWGGPAPRWALPLPPAKVIEVIERVDPPDPPPPIRREAAHQRIGELVAALLPHGATVQWGPGAVGAAVVDAIDRPVRVWSGLVTAELGRLVRRRLLEGSAVAAYQWGVTVGSLRLEEIPVTHDLTALSEIERFVAVNTAVQVGLDGSANVEMVAGRIVSGPGGHPDFATGASRSPGGLSIVALPSTAHGRSTVVVRPDIVSTPGADVDVVVTEHGVADLRGADRRERARRIAAIAAPEVRESLLVALDGPGVALPGGPGILPGVAAGPPLAQ